MCSNIGTPNNHHFPFGTNGKVVVLGVPILKHFRVSLFLCSDVAYLSVPHLISGYSGLFTSMIVMCMADFQVTRRFLECLFVSVYSEGGKMSIVIYIVGVAFYVGLAVTCLVGTDLTDVVLFKGG